MTLDGLDIAVDDSGAVKHLERRGELAERPTQRRVTGRSTFGAEVVQGVRARHQAPW